MRPHREPRPRVRSGSNPPALCKPQPARELPHATIVNCAGCGGHGLSLALRFDMPCFRRSVGASNVDFAGGFSTGVVPIGEAVNMKLINRVAASVLVVVSLGGAGCG